MTNLDIAQAATLQSIHDIAEKAGLKQDDYEAYGRYKAKLTYSGMARLQTMPRGKLVLVTAINPTPAGEGKTTTTVGLSQALCRLGHRAIPATREPALGPIFGVKGGACGGGYSQVLPMEDINLFFTGDMPAVSAAHNLLSAMFDAHIHNGNSLGLDLRTPLWPRTVDMNDRALRQIVVGLGGKPNGFVREDGFVVAPASEVMAVLCLSRSLTDLKERLGRILVGFGEGNAPVQAHNLQATGAMAALLRDAIRPNLVQTIEGGPAFVHGGPFGNIAHGCSSVAATECALGMGDYVITEGGFGSDLGAEKFLNIVTRTLGVSPSAIVLVATVRALQHHGGDTTLAGLEKGLANLWRHHQHLSRYGPPIVVAVNRRAEDADEQHELVRTECLERGITCVSCDPWGGGGAGCLELAEAVETAAASPSEFRPLYRLEDGLTQKLDSIVRWAYGGDGVDLSDAAKRRLEWAEKHGFGSLPACVAKTQYSLSEDPKELNAPERFRIHVRELRPSIGAGFLVAVAGEIMLMPGLGRTPAAQRIDVDAEGRISGLF